MFGFRTPAKAKAGEGEKSPTQIGEVAPTNVRRSIGEWEATNTSPTRFTTVTSQVDPVKGKSKTALTPDKKAATTVRKSIDQISPPKIKATNADRTAEEKACQAKAKVHIGSSKIQPQESKTLPVRGASTEVLVSPKKQYADRSAEARACLNKAKLHLSCSRNLKTEIKNGIIEGLERLFQLVKEAEKEARINSSGGAKEKVQPEVAGRTDTEPAAGLKTAPENVCTSKIVLQLEEHSKLLAENGRKMEELKEAMENQKQFLAKGITYASVAAAKGVGSLPKCNTLHSVVVTSKDESETGEEVLNRVREAANAKDGWIKVERVRKGKDRKVIIGLETLEERGKLKERLQKEGINLTVEEVKNKDPLLILKNVLVVNTDEDVLKAFRNQNRSVFDGLSGEENRVEIKYRRKTRNPHTGHIVVSVSPIIWHRALQIGTLHIDLQRVRVEDQTPLVQCTRCLGFGHGKRFCQEPADLCGHCGGPHMRVECPEWLSNSPPVCRNCVKAKLDHGMQHNAFSHDCPVRKRWDDIARSTVAYC